MKRLATLVLIASPLLAQADREPHRAAYRAWRDAAPTLEQDASAPKAEFATQAQAAAQAADRFLSLRAEFLTKARSSAAQQADWSGKPLLHPEPLLEVRPEVQGLLTRAGDFLNTSINNFATVKDPAIQQVRQAMERERAALGSLNQTLAGRTAAVKAVAEQTQDAEVLKASATRSLAAGIAARNSLVEHLGSEAAAWSAYYRDLIEGAAATPRVTSTAPNGNAPAPTPAKPVFVARPSPAGQTPLSRYIGTWAYPARNGIFLGAQPQTVELQVREENGKLLGSLVARFLIINGKPASPELRFEFQGEIQQNRKQVLPITTAEGVTGTLELIPGAAINLLEVNFQTQPNGNKVTTGNFVLVKR